jgi:hypothetical protein
MAVACLAKAIIGGLSFLLHTSPKSFQKHFKNGFLSNVELQVAECQNVEMLLKISTF